MKMKRLFNIHLLMLAALCSMAVVLGSCSSEENVPDGTGTSGTNDKNLTTFEAGTPKGTRTSMNPTTGDFFWEEGDRIYVLDDNNNWKGSNAVDAAHAGSSWFKFKVPGKFTAHNTYKVYYPGQMSTNDFANIPAAQTQTKPNTTKHFGMSGDCGVATATRATGERNFNFTLDHQSAILVFQPYTSNTVLHNCYLTKIEVTSNNDITGTYTFNPTTGALIDTGVTTVYNQAVLTTKDPTPGSANEKGFPLTNATASVSTNGAYMLIKPGTHTLRVRYWIKDYTTGTEGTITKNLSSFAYDKNTFYDMTANLDVRNYPANDYYMWDAQKPYWDGHEWDNANPSLRNQPTVNGQTDSHYAQNNSDPRWYHEGQAVPGLEATHSCATAPNINEMSWYAFGGAPHWDGDELWTTMGHLYKGGMWFLKKAYINHYKTNKDYNGADMRYGISQQFNYSIIQGPPSAADANKYFYLPAIGAYENGKLVALGTGVSFWSSTGRPGTSGLAGVMGFESGYVVIGTYYSNYAYKAWAFQ